MYSVDQLDRAATFFASLASRKRAELPDSYFGRLKAAGVNLEPHLLLTDVSDDPAKLKFDSATYQDFRDRRLGKIWSISDAIVNPEMSTTAKFAVAS